MTSATFAGIAPLMYHSVAPTRDDPYRITVRPERLDMQLRWLRRLGRTGTSVRELLRARRAGDGHRLIGLTFDDGYADFAEYALPILQHYGFTATLFPIAGRLGETNSWDPEGPRKSLLTAEQLRAVADVGIEIGSHGLRHVSLPSVADADLPGEIEQSRAILREITGQEVTGFCYPYGHIDERVVKAVEAAGYDYGCAIRPSEFPDRYALRRTYITDTDSPPRLWIREKCRSVSSARKAS